MGVPLVEFDVLRRKTESRMQMGGGFPEAFVSVLVAQNVSSPEAEKPLVLASIRAKMTGCVDRMRRLRGSRGGAARQDVLLAADADLAAGEESDHAAWLVRRNKKRKRNLSGGRTAIQEKAKNR